MAQSGTYATTMSFGAPVCYSPDMINIGNLKMTTDEIDPTIIRLRDHGRNDPKAGGNFGISLGHPYSYSDDNIGNLRSNKNENKGSSETYIDAMLKVYSGCYTVLKPGGRMIVIVKDFIRNFNVIRLHDHTRFLCEQCGFVFDEMLAFKLPTKSFWRTLYEKKHGDKVKDLELINYELVLVFHKPKPKSI
jgi:DNA modification methylase